MLIALLHVALALVLSPMLLSVAHRTKAFFAGRQGAPWLQPYFELGRLLRKGAVYSATTSWVFQIAPPLGLSAALATLALVPFAGHRAIVAFPGDVLLFSGLLALWRFATILAALDTGSSFEGMGASREAALSALGEPALILALGAIARQTGQLSLSGILPALTPHTWHQAWPVLALLLVTLSLVYVAENGRVPFDDPTTHLELTMIHEVMILDSAGPDLAFIEYAAALKLWILGSLVVAIVTPVSRLPEAWALLLALAGMAGVAMATGVTESIMARSRLNRLPKVLGTASILVAVALLLIQR